MSSSQVDLEEVIMLVRAVVAAKKHSITLKELAADYYECNVSQIPYRQLGYSTLVDFLQSQPDKFTVIKTPTEICIKAVVDSSIGQICRLVQGQRTASKKKKKSKAGKACYYPGYRKNQITSQFNRFGSSYQYHSNYTQTSNQSYGQQQRQSFNNYSSMSQAVAKRPPLKPMSENIPFSYNHQTSGMSKLGESRLSNKSLARRSSEHGSASNLHGTTSPSAEDRWINASYYLREHPVYITHIAGCDHVYLRLKGLQFSEGYTELKNNMDHFYRANVNNPSWRQVSLASDTICVASDKTKSSFYRVQIIKKEADDLYSCSFLDDGVTRSLPSSCFFKIQEPFTYLKFQAIKVYLPDFSQFGDNAFIKERLKHVFYGREFIAKRVHHEPLTVSLYSGNTSVTDTFYKDYRHFCLFKPSAGTGFTAMLTYIDSNSALSYVEVPNDSRDKFEEMMAQVNDYFSTADHVAEQALFKKEFNFDRDVNTLICCAKYAADGHWYRVKVLRLCPGEKYMAHFIDFGNREPVDISDFRLIPDTMEEFKFMPAQALAVSIVSNENFSTNDLERVYSSCTLYLGVMFINAAGLPTVQIMRAHENCTPAPSPQPQSTSNDVAAKINDIARSMSTLKIENSSPVDPEKEKTLDQINKSVKYDDLSTPDLPSGSTVYVTYVNNPSEFVINLELFRRKLDELQFDMKRFYSPRRAEYAVSELELEANHIYVFCDSKQEYHRVKFVDLVGGNKARVQDIDNGYYDAADMTQLCSITNRFIKMPPIAIKCRLANCIQDQEDSWSQKAIALFKELTHQKTFKASILNYSFKFEDFKIELHGPDFNVSTQFAKLLADK